jgi:AGCS family alanine or glycine:cation symporter
MQDVINLFVSAGNLMQTLSFFNVLSIFGITSVEFPISVFMLFIGFAYATIKLNFVQIKMLKEGVHQLLNPSATKEGDKNVSPIKALFTAVAGSAGLNNTAGMASMVLIGGPGTAFWIPIIIIGCMAFRFAEIYLSHHYRSEGYETSLGGPFDYMKKGFADLGFKKIGIFASIMYAVLMALGGLFGISLFELNQAVVIIKSGVPALHDQTLLVSLACTLIVGYVIFGGSRRISNFFGTVLPFLVGLFLTISLIVIFYNYKQIPYAFAAIIEDAFHPRAVAGGVIGSFVFCMKRMAMSSETGLGTAGIVHATSTEKSSVKEALGGMISPIINGVFICFVSAFLVVITGVNKGDGILLLFNAFGSVHNVLTYGLVLLIPIMAMNVMIGWSNYGMKCVEYVAGHKFVKPYLMLYLIVGFSGGFVDDFQVVMRLVEGSIMILAIVNVVAVITLMPSVKRALVAHNVHKKK